MAITVGNVLVDVLPDARGFNEKLAAQIRDLTAKVKIDIDTAGVTARIDEVKAKLTELGMKSPSIKVDVDTMGAEAKLAAVGAEADRTADKNRNLGSASSGAGGGMSALIQAAIGLSPALVAVGASAIGVAAALGTMAAAGAAGFGVATIAISGVTKAVGLLGQQQQAQQAAGAAAAQGAAAHAQAIVSAQRQIQTAEMSLGDARRAAATATITSAQQVQSAQYGLIQADRQEQQALQALQSAREAATRQLTSMANAAVDARLAEQQAVLDLQTAIANNNTTQNSATATAQQKQQAALDLAKAQQHLTESQQAATNAQVDNAKAQKLGVDGAPQVVSAAQGVAAAQHNQQQAAQNLANVQRNAADQQIKSQESIVRAQQGVAAAMDAMNTAQRNSTAATSASLAKINAQIAALDPATRSFAEYLRGTWGPIWKQVQAASSGGFLPGLQAGMDAMKGNMPGLIAFIKDISSRLGDMARNVGEAFNSPFWQQFFGFLSRTIGPALSSLGTTLGYIATGFAGLWMAFEPIIMPITKGIEGLAKRFADFGMQATGSSGFGKFIAYIRETGPQVMKVLGDLWQVLVHIVQALAPLAGPLLAGMSFLLDLLKQIPVPVLTAAAVAFAAIFAGMKLIQGISALAALNPWALAAVAIGAGFVLAYNGSKTFRDFINDKVLPTLQDWWKWIQQNVLPILKQLGDFITHTLVPVLAGIFMDAWNGIAWAVKEVSKAFSGNGKELGQLGTAISWLGGFIVKYIVPILGFVLKLAFETVGKAIGVVINIIGALVDTWNIMWAQGKALGHWFANDFVGFFVGAWDKIRTGFANLGHDVAALWNNLKHYLMDPVAFVVQYVINDGLIKAWNWVVGHLHLPGSWHADYMQVPAVPPLMKADGGYISGPGTGRSDSILARLSNGEFVVNANATAQNRALLEAINGGNHGAMSGGMRGFAGGGGVFGTIQDFVLPGVGAAKATSSQLDALLSDPLGAVSNLVKAAMGGLSSAAPMVGMLGDMLGSLAGGVGQKILDSLGSALGGGTAASGGGNASAPSGASVERWRGLVDTVLRLLGQPTTLDNGVLSLIAHESGGNPNAINLTDSNARAGHPSQGLMQTIPSTFAAYAGPYVGLGITSPLASIYAGTSYALHNYGAAMLAAGGRHNAAGQYIGYDSGGTLDPGYHMVYNGTGQTEIVAPRQTFDQVMSGASGGGAPSSFTGTLYLDSGEFLGKVRGIAQQETAGALTAIADRGAYSA